jgi:hypothetical protein
LSSARPILAHSKPAFEAGLFHGVTKYISYQNLLGLSSVLYPRRGIDHIAEHVAVFDQAKAGVNSHAYVYRFEFGLGVSLLFKHALHSGTSSYRCDRIIEAGHNGIAEGFDDNAAFTFNDRKKKTVVAINQRHVFEVPFFFRVSC